MELPGLAPVPRGASSNSGNGMIPSVLCLGDPRFSPLSALFPPFSPQKARALRAYRPTINSTENDAMMSSFLFSLFIFARLCRGVGVV